ncbi:hypothetical protein, partial [Pararhodospirillum oryzae]|uniref:hypothetical protein n=1 Tax=Pararhodospirillum oryzae TaxID=478448 RepID=UPI0011BD738F
MDSHTLTVSVPQSLAASFQVRLGMTCDEIKKEALRDVRAVLASIELIARPCDREGANELDETLLREALLFLCDKAS